MIQKYIICSAVWLDDGKKHLYQPKNINFGFVVCGRRHHNCFITIKTLLNNNEKMLKYKTINGFLTNNNEFLDRKDAGSFAYNNGQIKEFTECLFSEDLY